MPALIDRTGHRYGKLTVIAQDRERTRKGHTSWICRCDCGNITHVEARSLAAHAKGDPRAIYSCGCFRHQTNKA